MSAVGQGAGVALVQSLAWELPHATSKAQKQRKKMETQKGFLCPEAPQGPAQFQADRRAFL